MLRIRPPYRRVRWCMHKGSTEFMPMIYEIRHPASTHGSPWSYDTNVPLAMYGPNWIKAGKYGDSEVVDLARTIAFVLNVRPSNGCEGRVLSEALN